MKFGKPTKQEMQMATYDAEPDADAVVLCRLTDVEYTIQQTGYLVDYREKVRIKVLKPDGARFAKVVIPYLKNTPMDNCSNESKMVLKTVLDVGSVSSSLDEQSGAMTTDDLENYSEESIEDLKATAYNLRGSKVVKSVLKKDAFVPDLSVGEPEKVPEVPEEKIQVVRSKRFTLKPMSVEEAIMQMNLLGHSFFAFRNADDDGLFAVVYAREDGDYGLIMDEG